MRALATEPPSTEKLGLRDLHRLRADTAARALALYYTPGDRKNLKNVARLCSLIDAGILVVSAEQSVMPQTKEHARLAFAMGVPQLAVFINKCDLADDEDILDLVEQETREMLHEAGYDGDTIRVLRGAAGPALSGDDLWAPQALIELLDRGFVEPGYDSEAPFYAVVDTVFRRKPGCVIGVKIKRGTLRPKQTVMHFGQKVAERVLLRIEEDHEPLDVANAGGYYGVQMRGTTHAQIRRGDVLVDPKHAKAPDFAAQAFSARLSLNTAEFGGRPKPLFRGHQASFFIDNAAVQGSIDLASDTEMLMPGDQDQTVRIQLGRPIPLLPRQTLALRDGSDSLFNMLGPPPRWGGLAGAAQIDSLVPGHPGGDFQGRDFRGQDLRGTSFENAILRGADLSSSDIRGVNFQGADLRECKLDGANMTGVKMSNAQLNKATLRGANLQYADLGRSTLVSADFRPEESSSESQQETTLTGANFRGADLTGARFGETSMLGARFQAAQLSRAQDYRIPKEPVARSGGGFGCPLCGRAFLYQDNYRRQHRCLTCGWNAPLE